MDMRKHIFLVYSLAVLSIFFIAQFSKAAEHPGSTVEHPGSAINGDSVKKAIRDHVKAEEKANNGFFVLSDPDSNKTWSLKLEKIHDPVRMFEKDGQTVYFACSDFKSADSNDVLDIDFWMVRDGNKLKVIDTKIHKLNGKPRFTYEGIEIKPVE
jgi:hypothetical protein